jgi:hypothetical protein
LEQYGQINDGSSLLLSSLLLPSRLAKVSDGHDGFIGRLREGYVEAFVELKIHNTDFIIDWFMND